MRERLAALSGPFPEPSYIDELQKQESVVNDRLSLYTLWGGRITGTQDLAFQNAEPALLQKARAMLAELRNGVTPSHGTEHFAGRLVQSPLQEKAGLRVFDWMQEDWHQRFELFLPGHNLVLQEAGLFGGLNGASFHAEYKASLGQMSAEEYAFHSPPLQGEEAHRIACRILANRPAITTTLHLSSHDADLRSQAIRFALHFALALLDSTVIT